jgi:hypothetical protein
MHIACVVSTNAFEPSSGMSRVVDARWRCSCTGRKQVWGIAITMFTLVGGHGQVSGPAVRGGVLTLPV